MTFVFNGSFLELVEASHHSHQCSKNTQTICSTSSHKEVNLFHSILTISEITEEIGRIFMSCFVHYCPSSSVGMTIFPALLQVPVFTVRIFQLKTISRAFPIPPLSSSAVCTSHSGACSFLLI